jgi:hypothetical protein
MSANLKTSAFPAEPVHGHKLLDIEANPIPLYYSICVSVLKAYRLLETTLNNLILSY